MGNGESVQLQEHVCAGDSSFHSLYPHLFRPGHPYNVSIASVVLSHSASISWNFDFYRNHHDREIVELATLVTTLDSFSLSPNVTEKPVCSLHSSSFFFL